METTAGSIFCADYSIGECANCHTDADCEALGAPAGSACVPVATGYCGEFACPGKKACMPRCGKPGPAAAGR
jgi:hypothetical protein